MNHPVGFSPMPLERRREPFDHPDWLFELKYDGFRALAFVTGGGTKLVSRRGLEPAVAAALAAAVAKGRGLSVATKVF